MIHKKNINVAIVFIFMAIFSINSQTPVKLSTDQFKFTEGPVWDGNNKIFFTDIPNSKIISYNLSTNVFSDVYNNTNKANGLMFNKDYDLIICEGETGKLSKRSSAGVETVIDKFEGKRFNSPNDLCIDKKGGIYFTDPTWYPQHQSSNNLYYLNKDGVVSVEETFGNDKPNGVTISPDGLYLYVNNTWSDIIFRYDINSSTGKLSNRINFARLTNPDDSNITGADGMTVDANGNLYVTAKFTIQVFNSVGNPISTINFSEKTTNCVFGGVNKKTLFVTAGNNLYKLDMPDVDGFNHPFDLKEEDTTLSLLEIENTHSVRKKLLINSNPVHNKIIKLTNADGYEYRLADVQGQLILKGKVSNNLINVSKVLEQGVYIIQFSKNKVLVQTQKIIIK